MIKSALFTDYYELTMTQGYFLHKKNPDVVFDMFFRRQPFDGGFSIFAGLAKLTENLMEFRFSSDDIEYLRSLGTFKEDFLEFLKSFHFSGDMYAMHEGSIVFPGEPLIRIHSNLIEAQLIESMLLNIINFQTLIATKAARIYIASGKGKIIEFGLRRAQGVNGSVSASRAAFIGGAYATSNSLAGRMYNIPVKGTMAHSWIMIFDSEEDAFRKYSEIYPDNSIFLIDTYDTLGSGIDSAIKVGKELKTKGKRIGVRLDSGDLQYLSKEVRKRLDNAGLEDASISVSNELNEEIIHQLVTEQAPIDYWGVGTNLATGGNDSALTGVYKLAAKESSKGIEPTIKVSDNPVKTTNPGIKQLYRFYDKAGSPLVDFLTLDSEIITPDKPYKLYHPMYEYKHLTLSDYDKIEPMLKRKIHKGRIDYEIPSLLDIQKHALKSLDKLNDTYQRLINPHVYKVSLSESLKDIKFRMIEEHSYGNSFRQKH